jgi:hypothetical protein
MRLLKKHKLLSIIALIVVVVTIISSVFYALNVNGAFCGDPNNGSYYECKYPHGNNSYSQACVDEYTAHRPNPSGGIVGGFIPCPGTAQ